MTEEKSTMCENYDDNNISKFRERIYQIIDNSPFYMKCFYEESPSFSDNNMIDALIWLSYTNKEKNDILDDELDNYFK